MTMTMKKVLATGLGAAALLVLATPQAQAMTFSLSGTFASGGGITGMFDYNNGVYSNWQFTSSPTALTGAAVAPYTNPFSYTTSNSVTGVNPVTGATLANTSTKFTFRSTEGTATGNQTRALQFLANAGLDTLTKVGDSTTLKAGLPVSSNSYEYYIKAGGSNSQNMGLSAGTIVAVPEPLTILGAATAMGFGAMFKRRSLKSGKKG